MPLPMDNVVTIMDGCGYLAIISKAVGNKLFKFDPKFEQLVKIHRWYYNKATEQVYTIIGSSRRGLAQLIAEWETGKPVAKVMQRHNHDFRLTEMIWKASK